MRAIKSKRVITVEKVGKVWKVLPKPTSSAQIAPFDKGDLNANKAT